MSSESHSGRESGRKKAALPSYSFFNQTKLDRASRGGRNGGLLIPRWCLDQSSSKIKCKIKPGAGALAPNQPGI